MAQEESVTTKNSASPSSARDASVRCGRGWPRNTRRCASSRYPTRIRPMPGSSRIYRARICTLPTTTRSSRTPTSTRCSCRRRKASMPRRCGKRSQVGKAVLVEKPLALSLNDAEAIINTLKRTGAPCASATAAASRNAFCAPRSRWCTAGSAASAAAWRGSIILAPRLLPSSSSIRMRDPGARRAHLLRRPDVLVPRRNAPVEVVARAASTAFSAMPATAPTTSPGPSSPLPTAPWSNFGISYALPANYPTQGQSDRVELS